MMHNRHRLVTSRPCSSSSRSSTTSSVLPKNHSIDEQSKDSKLSFNNNDAGILPLNHHHEQNHHQNNHNSCFVLTSSSIWGHDDDDGCSSFHGIVQRLESAFEGVDFCGNNQNEVSPLMIADDEENNNINNASSSDVARQVMNIVFRSSLAIKTLGKSVTAYFETRMLLDRTRFCQELILRSATQQQQYQKESTSNNIKNNDNDNISASNELSDYYCILLIKLQLSFNEDLRRDWYWYRVSVPLDDLYRYVEAHHNKELPCPSTSGSSAAVDFLSSANQVSSHLREMLFVPHEGKPHLACSLTGSSSSTSTTATATDQNPQQAEVPMFGDSLVCTGYCYVEHDNNNKGVHENASCFDVGKVVHVQLESYNFYKHPKQQQEEETGGNQPSSNATPLPSNNRRSARNNNTKLIDASSESRLFPPLLLRAFPFEFSRSAGFSFSAAAASSSSTSSPPSSATRTESSSSRPSSRPPERNHRILRRATIEEIRQTQVLKEKANRDFVLLTTEFQGYLNGSGGPQTQREREDRKKIVFDPNFVSPRIADLVTRFFPPLELWSGEFRKLYGLLDHTSGNSSLTTIMHSKKLPYAHREKIKNNVMRSRDMNLPILAEALRQITFLRCDYQADGKLLRVAFKFSSSEEAGKSRHAAAFSSSSSSMVAPHAVSAGYHLDLTKITPVLLSFLSNQFGCSVILYNPYFYVERANCGATTAEQHPPLLLNPLADALYHQYCQGEFQSRIEQELQEKV